MKSAKPGCIRIGILYSVTGTYGPVGREMLNGISLAIEEVNSSDEFAFRFAPVAYDPGGDLDAYEAACETLIRRDGVRHIVGCYTSAARKRVLPLIEKSDRLLWHSARYEGFESSPNVIYVGAAPNQHVVPLARHMIRRLGHEVYCVGSDYIWTWETNRVFREIVCAAGGRLLAERLVPLGGGGARALVPEILAKRPPIVLNTLVGAASYEFLRALHATFRDAPQRHWRPVIISCSLCEPELRLVGGAAALGHLTSSVYFSTIDTPENRQFVERWRTRFGSYSSPSVDAEASYLCGALLARAIQRCGSEEVDAVRRTAYRDEFDAPQGPVRVDADNNHCFLTPRLGRSVAGAVFEIIEEAPAPVKPDPFLAWTDIDEIASSRVPDQREAPRRAANRLRVVE